MDGSHRSFGERGAVATRPAPGPLKCVEVRNDVRRGCAKGRVAQPPAYDLVLIDSPPFLQGPETVDLAKAVDAVVVAVRAGRTGEAAMHSILGYLRRLNARLAGIVINDA